MERNSTAAANRATAWHDIERDLCSLGAREAGMSMSWEAENEVELCRDLIALLVTCSIAARDDGELTRTLHIASAYAKQIMSTVEMLGRHGRL